MEWQLSTEGASDAERNHDRRSWTWAAALDLPHYSAGPGAVLPEEQHGCGNHLLESHAVSRGDKRCRSVLSRAPSGFRREGSPCAGTACGTNSPAAPEVSRS